MDPTPRTDADEWVVVNPLAPDQTQSSQSRTPVESRDAGPRTKKNTKDIPCRFWGTATGCRAGEKCHFRHDPAVEASSVEPQAGADAPAPATRQYNAPPVAKSRIVPKPVAKQQTKDPRSFEIQQVRRRHAPQETSGADGTRLAMKLVPSDPDFPFELEHLDCVLLVPESYPKSGKPSLQVRNEEMQRIHQAAVEQGFDSIVAEAPSGSLLSYLNSLDRRLEEFLSGERDHVTFKLVANRGVPQYASAPETSEDPPTWEDALASPHVQMAPLYSAVELSEAATRRSNEIRQLEARLGRLHLYARIDDYTYTLPLQPRKRDELPLALQGIKSVHLHVPEAYPLEPCIITIPGVLEESAVLAEVAFEDRAVAHKDQALLAHINYLAQNLHIFATQVEPEKELEPVEEIVDNVNADKAPEVEHGSHVHYIARPPEWEDDSGEGSASEEDGESEGSEFDEEQDAETHTAEAGPDIGFAVDLESMNFLPRGRYGVYSADHLILAAAAEITALQIMVQCGRCKHGVELYPTVEGREIASTGFHGISTDGTATCVRCTSQLRAHFRPRVMVAGNARAGFLDLTGCRPVHVEPKHFLLTCSNCGTGRAAYCGGGFPGGAAYTQCNSCPRGVGSSRWSALGVTWTRTHVLYQPARGGEVRLPPRRDLAAEGRWQGGTALPGFGTCDHYARSYRWFRFGCCARLYPCDRCHDAAADHPCERATRMMCGYCSREQPFRLNDCGRCGARLVKARASTGFWEGGKGTRERSRMSRKDPRKYRRPGHAAVGGKTKEDKQKKKDEGAARKQ